MVKWKFNTDLANDLDRYAQQKLRRAFVLDYMQRDYPQYRWSLRTLDRRLRYFNIYYTGDVDPDDVVEAVKKELDGPGQLLGYRAMHLVVRQVCSV